MAYLFKQASSVLRESGKSPLGFGSLLVLSVATVGIFMFKDARDEHVKLYAFLALLGSFMLCLFTLVRSTRKVAQKVDGRLAPAPGFELGGLAGSILQAPPVPGTGKKSNMAGCLVGIILFGAVGSCMLLAIVAASMDLNWDKVAAANNSSQPGGIAATTSIPSAESTSHQGDFRGYISMSDALAIAGAQGPVTVTVYSFQPNDLYGAQDFKNGEIIRSEPSKDNLSNPVTLLTVDAPKMIERAKLE